MKYREIINEWFAHLPKGYALPPYTQQEEEVLHQVLQKYNVSRSELNERINDPDPVEAFDDDFNYTLDVDDVREPYKFFIPNSPSVNETQDQESIPKSDLDKLKSKLESDELKDKYSKYLTVFYYFSPNSLGEISEILLANLLGGMHTGGKQGLSDLEVGGTPISLKTTDSKKAINLGSHENLIPDSSTIKNLKKLQDLGNVDMTVSNLEKLFKGDPIYGTAIQDIETRIEAIAKKLAGSDNKEYFVWVEKKSKDKVLTDLIIHTKKYDLNTVINQFKQLQVNVSRSGWNLSNDNGVVVGADSGGKYLNVMPGFVRSDSQNPTLINLVPIKSILGTPTADSTADAMISKIQGSASKTFFDALDSIYNNFISKLKPQQ